jgi:gluconolactonase
VQTLTARSIARNVGATEGPVIRADGEIVFVSVDQARLYRVQSGETSVLAELPGGPNGATEGRDGTIYVAQCGGRWGRNKKPDWSFISGVQAVGRDGNVRWLSTDPIAPNDICFGPDGCLYVTDPTRYRDARDDGRLFRVHVETGETEILCSLEWYPNGIGFGPDDALYVAKSGPDYGIVRFSLANGRLERPEEFIRMGTYKPDGVLFDAEGNFTTAAISTGEGPGQIQTYDSSGRSIDSFVPRSHKEFTNVALGSDRRLIITSPEDGSVLAVDGWPYAGLPLHPFR